MKIASPEKAITLIIVFLFVFMAFSPIYVNSNNTSSINEHSFNNNPQVNSYSSNSPSNAGHVEYTLIFNNNSLLSGNVVNTFNKLGPFAITYDSENQYIYVTDYYSNNVSVINSVTNKIVDTIAVGTLPAGVAYDPANQYVYITNGGSKSVSIINNENKVVGTINVGSKPAGLAYDPENKYMYVANSGSNSISVINSANNVVDTIAVGSQPVGLTYNPANQYIYVTNWASDNVSIINNENIIAGTINVGSEPAGLIYDPENKYMYFANFGSGNVSIINDENIIAGTINVGSEPTGVAYDPENKYIYVLNYGSNSISVINSADNIVKNITVGDHPEVVTYDTLNKNIYVTNRESGSLSIISNAYAATYKVTFTETGLPSGIEWYVKLSNGMSSSSTTSTISFNELNGSYSYTISNVPGYMLHPGSGTITVNGTKLSESVTFFKTGLSLGENMANVNGNVFYINSTLNEVIVINSRTQKVTKTIQVGLDPIAVASFSSVLNIPSLYYLGDIIVVANQGSDNVTFINTSSMTIIGNVSVGSEPVDIATGNGIVAVSDYESKNVVILDVANINKGIKAVSKFMISLAYYPTGVTFNNPYSNELFVSLYNGHKVEQFNIGTHIRSYSVSGYIYVRANPMGITMDRNGYLYVADEGSSAISVVIPDKGKYPSYANFNISVGDNPINVAVLNSGRFMFLGAVVYLQISIAVVYLDSSNITFIPAKMLGNPHPYINMAYGFMVKGVAAFNSSAFFTINPHNSVVFINTYPITFNSNNESASFSLGNMVIGSPYMHLPSIIMLPAGEYKLAYFLNPGYESPSISTTGSVSLSTYSLSSLSYTLKVAGAGKVTVRSSPIPNWVNSGDFDVSSYTINFGHIGPFVINSNLVSHPLKIYVLLPSSGESLKTFYSNLKYYFNVTVPSGYRAVTTIILSLPVVQILNSILGANIQEKSYTLPLGNYLSFLGIQNITTTPSGSLNLALTISSSLNSNQLLKDILKTVENTLLNFLKGEKLGLKSVLKGLNNVLKDILDTVDLTVTDITSPLQNTSKLSAFTVVDIATLHKKINKIINKVMKIPDEIEKVKNTVEDLIDDVETVMGTPDKFEAWMDVAAGTPPPFDAIPAAVAINSAIDGGLHLSNFVLVLGKLVWPSLSSNQEYETFSNMVKIGLEIEDPNGTTIMPSVYISNTLALGYNNTTGNVITHSEYGNLIQTGSGYHIYVYSQYSSNMDIILNGIGGNEQAPYKLIVNTNSSFTEFTGMVKSNASISIPLIVNSTGSIESINYLVPKLVVDDSNYHYEISTTAFLEDGKAVNASSAMLIMGNKDYTMERLNNTSFKYVLPYNEVTSNVIKIYVTSPVYAGGYVSLYLPMHKIYFREEGLPAGTLWNASLENTTQYSNSNLTIFYEPNGNYTYFIEPVQGYVEEKGKGNITTKGFDTNITIEFVKEYKIVFKETGLPAGTEWYVNGTGMSDHNSLPANIIFMLTNGTYTYTITNLSSYYTVTSHFTVTIDGNNVTETVHYYHWAYIAGKISPSNAILTINGKTVSTSPSGYFNVSVANGTYHLVVSEKGHKTYYRNLTMNPGKAKNLTIDLKPVSKPSSISGIEIYAIIGVVAAIAVIAGAVLLIRKRR